MFNIKNDTEYKVFIRGIKFDGPIDGWMPKAKVINTGEWIEIKDKNYKLSKEEINKGVLESVYFDLKNKHYHPKNWKLEVKVINGDLEQKAFVCLTTTFYDFTYWNVKYDETKDYKLHFNCQVRLIFPLYRDDPDPYLWIRKWEKFN